MKRGQQSEKQTSVTGKPEHIAIHLRSGMASGRYPAGCFLPAERQLAVELGVARNTLRAALDLLEQEGRLDRRPGRGALVRDPQGTGLHGLVSLIVSQPLKDGALSLQPENIALLIGTLGACSGSNIRFRIQHISQNAATELTDSVKSGAVAGLLFMECSNAALLDALRAKGVPHVVINQERDFPGPATRVDFWSVGRKAADTFLSLGHRRLGVLSGLPGHYIYDRMLAGFRGRAAETEVYLGENRVAHVATCSETARRAALGMLKTPNRPTAIFCTRDMRAYGAYQAARELGLRIPQDLSLIGYDDITWPGEGRTLLTTFPEPTRELGAAAIAMLSSYIQTGIPPEDTIIDPDIIARGSTARAPKS